MIYFADRIDDDRLAGLLDDRVEKLRETVKHIESIQSRDDGEKTVGANFVAGFGAVIAEAAANYIEMNRHMLTGQNKVQRTAMAGPAKN
jgi:hypothetical protein